MTNVCGFGQYYTRTRADGSQNRSAFLAEVFEEGADIIDRMIALPWPEDQIMAMLEAWEAAGRKVPPGGSLLLLRIEEDFRHKHIRAKDAHLLLEHMVWSWPSGRRPRHPHVARALQEYEYARESPTRGGLLKSPWGGD